ncbi:hypothetical protein, partial [Duncaniella muris]|uniref:hypothetical protein n=1 Tax=Duncaniella muris TaxID=2094150 RepID=UPI0025B76A50
GLLHRCLRPARLPIPPSGQVLFSFGSRRTLQVVRDLDGHKGSDFFYYRQLFELGFAWLFQNLAEKTIRRCLPY